MTSETTCVHCGWLVSPEGVSSARADKRPEGAAATRCQDTACVTLAPLTIRVTEATDWGAVEGATDDE